MQSYKSYFIKLVQNILIHMYQFKTQSSFFVGVNFITYFDVIFRVLKFTADKFASRDEI